MNATEADVRPVVVCVDDDPAILTSLERELRNEPYRVLITSDPGQALAWVSERDVRLILSDQRMPGMAGTELLEEVARRSPGTARFILTAFPRMTVAVRGIDRQIEGLISKPWDAPMLRRIIRGMLGVGGP